MNPLQLLEVLVDSIYEYSWEDVNVLFKTTKDKEQHIPTRKSVSFSIRTPRNSYNSLVVSNDTSEQLLATHESCSTKTFNNSVNGTDNTLENVLSPWSTETWNSRVHSLRSVSVRNDSCSGISPTDKCRSVPPTETYTSPWLDSYSLNAYLSGTQISPSQFGGDVNVRMQPFLAKYSTICFNNMMASYSELSSTVTMSTTALANWPDQWDPKACESGTDYYPLTTTHSDIATATTTPSVILHTSYSGGDGKVYSVK